VSEKLDPTWIAYALDHAGDRAVLEAGVRRVRSHYDTLVDYPTRAQSELRPHLGLVVVGDAEPRCRWPHFAADHDLTVATAYVPTGWQHLVGALGPDAAPVPLGRAILAAPEAAAARLATPFVLGVIDHQRERLVVVNDCLATGRLYEFAFDGGRVWSNRAAAPLLFAGAEPRADERGWRLLAAASWVIGDATLLRGVRKVGPGVVIEAGAPGEVSKRSTDAAAPLVRSSRVDVRELVAPACEEAVRQARTAGQVWPGRAAVDLSGGRDSRTVAGAVLRAGLDARFNTSDVVPGEADIARQLVASAPKPMEHHVRKGSDDAIKAHDRPVLDRALNAILLHDGMRHPQKMRGKQTLPRTRPLSATLSGHGGDVAHGWLYKTQRDLRRVRWGGTRARRARIMRLFTKDHGAARPEAYEDARAEADLILADARRMGIRGPVQLEWFYVIERFANRTGIGAHAERVSIFGTPEFLRAAFAQRPEERVQSLLHRLMVAHLVPEWAGIPFFKAERARMRHVRRLRIWDAPEDAAVVDRILASDGPWAELYDPERVRSAWREVRNGGGKASWEAIFEGAVYREAFERYLAIISTNARTGPALAGAR
jgi:hypothetical protein